MLAATLVFAADAGCRSERGDAPADSLASRPRTDTVLGTPPTGPIQEADYVIAGVALGADSASVMAALGRPDSVEVQGHPYDTAGLRVWQFRDLTVEFADNHVQVITIRTPAVATARGIRIGATADRLLAMYGEPAGRSGTSWRYEEPSDDPSGLPPGLEFRVQADRVAGVSVVSVGYENAPPDWWWARPPWFIVGEGIGPVTRTTSEQELRERFGSEEVAQDTIRMGEGEFELGTVLFVGRGDPSRRIQILWADPDERRAVREIRVHASVWRTREGVAVGRRLRELEALNGRPFELSGWGWDYGGSDCGWAGGRLAAPLRGVHLRFGDDGLSALRSALSEAEVDALLGERCRSSSMRPMQRLNPAVVEIRIVFGR